MKPQKNHLISWINYAASLKIKPNDPLKLIFESIQWDFLCSFTDHLYADYGVTSHDPVSLFKAQLAIYLGEARSDRDLANKLPYDGRLCYLCGFDYLRTPDHSTFTNFRKRLGEETFYMIVDVKSQLPVEITLTPGNEHDSTQVLPLLKSAKQIENLPLHNFAADSAYDQYDIYRAAINYAKRTAVERCNSEAKEQHFLNKLRVRGLPAVKIHSYLSLSALILKKISLTLPQSRSPAYAFT